MDDDLGSAAGQDTESPAGDDTVQEYSRLVLKPLPNTVTCRADAGTADGCSAMMPCDRADGVPESNRIPGSSKHARRNMSGMGWGFQNRRQLVQKSCRRAVVSPGCCRRCRRWQKTLIGRRRRRRKRQRKEDKTFLNEKVCRFSDLIQNFSYKVASYVRHPKFESRSI
jgi:hypothetical protein